MKKVAYETLSKRERKTTHLAAAEFIERGPTGEEDELIEVIASHYLDAYEAAPDAEDADEIKAKARAALVRAGERAMPRSSRATRRSATSNRPSI